jgi:hypothetical protein
MLNCKNKIWSKTMKDRAKKAITKKAKKGFLGYPEATVALYGPTDKKATKLVVAIIEQEKIDPEHIKKWFSENDIRHDFQAFDEAMNFIKEYEAKSVVMLDRIIGCPHEEGIDYPEGQSCPECPFWHGRNRWTGEREH